MSSRSLRAGARSLNYAISRNMFDNWSFLIEVFSQTWTDNLVPLHPQSW
ncbi:MAG: hypothetical protein M3Y72_17200 [Acidobacteriota bacterium]|nr:hypothetical protein [Acidobacteriota bacterium]